jgi:hypothetical protein
MHISLFSCCFIFLSSKYFSGHFHLKHTNFRTYIKVPLKLCIGTSLITNSSYFRLCPTQTSRKNVLNTRKYSNWRSNNGKVYAFAGLKNMQRHDERKNTASLLQVASSRKRCRYKNKALFAETSRKTVDVCLLGKVGSGVPKSYAAASLFRTTRRREDKIGDIKCVPRRGVTWEKFRPSAFPKCL